MKKVLWLVVLLLAGAWLPQTVQASVDEAWECVAAHGGFRNGSPVPQAKRLCRGLLNTSTSPRKEESKQQAAVAQPQDLWQCVDRNGGFDGRGNPVKRARQACRHLVTQSEKSASGSAFAWTRFGGNPANRAFKNQVRHIPYEQAKQLARVTAEKMVDGMLAQAGKTVPSQSKELATQFVADSLLDETRGLSAEDAKASFERNVSWREKGILATKTYGAGATFLATTFGHAEVKGQTIAHWKDGPKTAHVLHVAPGLDLPWFPGCGNATLEDVQPPIPPTAQKPPERPLELGVPEVIPAAVATYTIDWDLWASGGGVYGSGSNTHFGYLSGGVYPLKKDFKDGRLVAGIAGFGNWWQGATTEASPYHFRGNRWGVGPGIKYYDWRHGWDVRFSPFYGQYADMGRSDNGKFQARLWGQLVGADVGFNYYDRQRRGEAWFAKTQVWIQGGGFVGQNSKEAWMGQALGSKRHLGGVISTGVRQFIYDWKDVGIRTFASAELFAVTPETINLGIGVGANWEDIIWCWAGPNIDLRHGGNVSGLWTCGVDAAAGVRRIQNNIRQDNFGAGQKVGGMRYDERTGILYVPESHRDLKSKKLIKTPAPVHVKPEQASYDETTGVLTVN